MVQRAKVLGLFDEYRGDVRALKARHGQTWGSSKPRSRYAPGVDPRDETFEKWLRKSGLTVTSKRASRRAHVQSSSADGPGGAGDGVQLPALLSRLKHRVWDGAVSFDVDVRTNRFLPEDEAWSGGGGLLSGGGSAGGGKGGGEAEEGSASFAQQHQDSSITISFATQDSPLTKKPELVAMVHFSDPETAARWKRGLELEASDPASVIKGFGVAWHRSIAGHLLLYAGTTLLYLALLPAVTAVAVLMFFWRELSREGWATLEHWRRRYERVSFATIARRRAGRGKAGRPMIHDAMSRATFDRAWLRKLDTRTDHDKPKGAGRGGVFGVFGGGGGGGGLGGGAKQTQTGGSQFFVESSLLHSLTTYISTFPDKNPELKMYRNTASQLGDFAENHLEVDKSAYDPRRIANKYVNAFIMLLSFSHVTLSLTVLELVDCSEQPGLPYQTLDVDPSIRCDSPEHAELRRIFFVFAPAYILGIPLLIELLIYTQVIAPGLRNAAEAKARFGYFYNKYNPDAWWWEATFMARKLAVPALKMFTDSMVVLVQITGAFLLFLLFALGHNAARPFIEDGCNFCDTLALSAHVFVMFAGAMYQTGRLHAGLSSGYAYLFIFVNTGTGLYLFNFARREVCQSLPLIGMALSSEFWVDNLWPYVFAAVRLRLVGGARLKQRFVECQDAFEAFYFKHEEDDYRAAQALRLDKQPILSAGGRRKAKEWIRDYSSTMRDALLYNQYLDTCKAEINRSVFVYMISSPRYTHTNQFEYAKYDKWLSSFGAALRVMREHETTSTRLLSQGWAKAGQPSSALARKGVVGRDAYKAMVSFGSVDVENLLQALLPGGGGGGGGGARGSGHGPAAFSSGDSAQNALASADVRPYVDFDGSGNYYLCLVEEVDSLEEIHVRMAPTKCPPHRADDDDDDDNNDAGPSGGGGGGGWSGRLVPLPPPGTVFTVSVTRLRVYSRVQIKDHQGDLWPGEITRAQPDGLFRVRDPIHGDYAFPVGRADLSRQGPPPDKPVGYLWRGFGEEEADKEVSPLRREDLEVYLHSAEALASERVPCKQQIEWLQSRLVLSPPAVGGRGATAWAGCGFGDGTADLWSCLDFSSGGGGKMFTLQHGEPVRYVWISPLGHLCATVSESYLCFWDVPRDRDLGNPSRLPNREPWDSRFFQAESLSVDLFEPDEKELSEFVLPLELAEAKILAIGNAAEVPDQTSVWFVAASAQQIYLYGCSQRLGFVKAMAWRQPGAHFSGSGLARGGDPVVRAEITTQDREDELALRAQEAVAAQVEAAFLGRGQQLKGGRSAKDRPRKHPQGSKAQRTAQRLAEESSKTAEKKAAEVAAEARTQVLVLTTARGRVFTVHVGGFPKAPKTEISAGATATAVDAGIWAQGATVLQEVQPEREREHRLALAEKLEAQIQGLRRELVAEAGLPVTWLQKAPGPAAAASMGGGGGGGGSARGEEELREVRRLLEDLEPESSARGLCASLIDLVVKKLEYLAKHDVETSVVDSYLCGDTMRAVLLIREKPLRRRPSRPAAASGAGGRWYLRAVALRRDPRASLRDVAPRFCFAKVGEDSCDLSPGWPATDPAFFDAAACCILARGLGREVNGYEGSFGCMSSKRSFEATLDNAFAGLSNARKEADGGGGAQSAGFRYLAELGAEFGGGGFFRGESPAGSPLLTPRRGPAAGPSGLPLDLGNKASLTPGAAAEAEGMATLSFQLAAPRLPFALHVRPSSPGLFVASPSRKRDGDRNSEGGASSLGAAVQTGDRVVAANGEASYGSILDPAEACRALEALLRAGPLTLELERRAKLPEAEAKSGDGGGSGDGKEKLEEGSTSFEATMNDGPLLGLVLVSARGLLVIHRVHPGSPAALVGVRAGDRVMSVGGDSAFASCGAAAAEDRLRRLLAEPPHVLDLLVLRPHQPAPDHVGTGDGGGDGGGRSGWDGGSSGGSRGGGGGGVRESGIEGDGFKLGASTHVPTLIDDEGNERRRADGQLLVLAAGVPRKLRSVKVRVPPGAQPGDTVRVPGAAAPVVLPPQSKAGLVVEVEVPAELTEAEAREAAEAEEAERALRAAAKADHKSGGFFFGGLFGRGKRTGQAGGAAEGQAAPAAAPAEGDGDGGDDALEVTDFSSDLEVSEERAQEPQTAASASQGSETVSVRVPDGAGAGDLLEFPVAGDPEPAQVEVPPEARPGDLLRTRVPRPTPRSRARAPDTEIAITGGGGGGEDSGDSGGSGESVGGGGGASVEENPLAASSPSSEAAGDATTGPGLSGVIDLTTPAASGLFGSTDPEATDSTKDPKAAAEKGPALEKTPNKKSGSSFFDFGS